MYEKLVRGVRNVLELIDGGEGISTGTTLAAGYDARRGVYCNTAGTYRIWGENGTYNDRYLNAGQALGIINTKITTTGGAAVTDGSIIAEA